MSGENAMPEARLAIALYTVNSDGTVSQTGNAALVNGTQLYRRAERMPLSARFPKWD